MLQIRSGMWAAITRLIETFTDPGDIVIDPCAGSGSTLRAAAEIGRHSYGFEVDRKMYGLAKEKMLVLPEETPVLFSEDELRQSTI